jgi:S1-C subfamily serine protease
MMRKTRMPLGLLSGALLFLAVPGARGEPVAKKPGPAVARPKQVPEKLRRGVVVIENAGKPLALGVALGGDGRILTASPPLGDADHVDLRYADGSTVPARVAHRSAGRNLALVVPSRGRWNDGLMASESDPGQDAKATAFVMNRTGAAPVAVTIKGKKALAAAGDAPTSDVFEMGAKLDPGMLGSPVIDDAGAVVAIVTKGCLPQDKHDCVPAAVGVPVDSLRTFLRDAPASAAMPTPWLGVRVVSDAAGFARGVRVRVVESDSPADDAGLRGGAVRSKADLIVAVDGTPVTSPERLVQEIRAHAIGDRVSLLVFTLTEGKFKLVPVVLAAPPAPPAPSSPPGSSPAEP